MKKIIPSIFLFALIIGFSGQSWAFGSRHHHGGGQGYSDQGGSSGNDSPTGNGGPGSNQGTDPGQGNNTGPNGGDNNNFPTAPVPEPMSLSLLGTGLAGFFLKRKIS